MANIVVIGKRGSDYGMFVSQDGVDVTDTTSTTPLAFDSRASTGLSVHSYGQTIIVPEDAGTHTYNGTSYSDDNVVITHNLGYVPAFAIRWCTDEEISSGVATKVWTPGYWGKFEQIDEGEEEEENLTEMETVQGLSYTCNTTALKIRSETYFNANDSVSDGNESDGSAGMSPYYLSYVIFDCETFTGGESL